MRHALGLENAAAAHGLNSIDRNHRTRRFVKDGEVPVVLLTPVETEVPSHRRIRSSWPRQRRPCGLSRQLERLPSEHLRTRSQPSSACARSWHILRWRMPRLFRPSGRSARRSIRHYSKQRIPARDYRSSSLTMRLRRPANRRRFGQRLLSQYLLLSKTSRGNGMQVQAVSRNQ